MAGTHGPLYEVTLSVDREIVEEFDAWLAEHIREMLRLPGFVSAETFEAEAESPERAHRIVQYLLENEQALEAYLAGPAAGMRRSGASRFPDQLETSRRVLHPTDRPEWQSPRAESCLNCGSPLLGQYCANCGQRARGRLISLWELFRDAIGDLFEVDSRLWRTLIPLMLRPGQLTHDYLVGRRARFMPPFRTYLVLSIVFFLVAFFDPHREFGILYEPATPADESAVDRSKSADEIRREVLDELAAEGIYVPRQAREEAGAPGVAVPSEPPAQPPADEKVDDSGFNVRIDPERGMDTSCNLGDYQPDGPEWFTRRFTRERLQQICEKVVADSGQSFLNQLLDNVPAALFVLLPLTALILKMLYPLSKRYYVEHLLFVLHFHAFFFLVLTLEVLFSRLVSSLGLTSVLTNLSVFVVSVYVPIYLYKSMRRVYAQGRTITILKFFVLVFTYLVGLSLMLAFAAFYTAFSI